MEEEYDSVGSSTSSDLGAGEDETAGRRKRLDAALRSEEWHCHPHCTHHE